MGRLGKRKISINVCLDTEIIKSMNFRATSRHGKRKKEGVNAL